MIRRFWNRFWNEGREARGEYVVVASDDGPVTEFVVDALARPSRAFDMARYDAEQRMQQNMQRDDDRLVLSGIALLDEAGKPVKVDGLTMTRRLQRGDAIEVTYKFILDEE